MDRTPPPDQTPPPSPPDQTSPPNSSAQTRNSRTMTSNDGGTEAGDRLLVDSESPNNVASTSQQTESDAAPNPVPNPQCEESKETVVTVDTAEASTATVTTTGGAAGKKVMADPFTGPTAEGATPEVENPETPGRRVVDTTEATTDTVTTTGNAEEKTKADPYTPSAGPSAERTTSVEVHRQSREVDLEHRDRAFDDGQEIVPPDMENEELLVPQSDAVEEDSQEPLPSQS
ncbi:uncharacterized protein LOC144747714 [Ciona intestinalis]